MKNLDEQTPEQIATAALPAYERFKSHGRIAGDDLLLHKFGEIATPAAWLELLRDRNRLQSELEQWTKWNIVEIAVRNPQVSEWMKHWETRCLKAESECARLQALIDGASMELPPIPARDSGHGQYEHGQFIFFDAYIEFREAATLAIAKERALRKAAEETMVYQHRGLEEETTLREEAEASIAILEEELKQYKKERAENSKHYNRLAGLLFSGALNKLTSNDCQKWADEYVNWKQRAEAAEEELKQYKQDNGILEREHEHTKRTMCHVRGN